jgi:predicted metal-dependent hydrolase
MQHPNHSPAYWDSVKRVIPDYKESRQWLKDHGASLIV